MKRAYLHRALCASLAALTLLSSTPSAFAADFTGGFTASLTATVSGVVIADGDYQVGLYDDQSMGWNIQYGSTENDKAHMVVDWMNMEKHEIFRVINRGNGLISIHPLHALDLCLNAQYGAACEKASDVILHNYEDGDAASLWQPIDNGDGSYTLKNAACGYVIDLNCGNYSIGNNFLLWDQTGVDFIQSFYFMPVGVQPSGIADGDYQIGLYNDQSLGWNIQYASTEIDEAHMVVDGLNMESNEIFRVVNRGNGLISIHPLHALDLCLNAQYGAACEKGSDVILHNYEDGDTASLWQPIRHADGSYTLKNAACNYVIDLNHGNYSVGNNFLLWSHSTAIYIQSFYFMPVDSAPSNPGNPSVSDRQQRMVDVALSYLGNTGYNGYCQKFVRVVGEKIGLPSGGAPTALDACDWWRVSTSMDNIPVGATVYLRSKKRSSLGYKYGHVGIYIGNGQVVHAQETVKQSSLSSMLNSYDYLGWGWQAGVDLR